MLYRPLTSVVIFLFPLQQKCRALFITVPLSGNTTTNVLVMVQYEWLTRTSIASMSLFFSAGLKQTILILYLPCVIEKQQSSESKRQSLAEREPRGLFHCSAEE